MKTSSGRWYTGTVYGLLIWIHRYLDMILCIFSLVLKSSFTFVFVLWYWLVFHNFFFFHFSKIKISMIEIQSFLAFSKLSWFDVFVWVCFWRREVFLFNSYCYVTLWRIIFLKQEMERRQWKLRDMNRNIQLRVKWQPLRYCVNFFVDCVFLFYVGIEWKFFPPIVQLFVEENEKRRKRVTKGNDDGKSEKNRESERKSAFEALPREIKDQKKFSK